MDILSVACGTYDGSVFVLAYSNDSSHLDCPSLTPVLVDPSAHNGSVTSVAVAESIVVSGATDEAIQLFSIPQKARLGSLDVHTGTIRCLEFAPGFDTGSPLHLLSASDDGSIAVLRQLCDDKSSRFACPMSWECIRVLRRHKGPVLSLSIHPSARCAYSICEDQKLRIWNLMRGRQAYATRLKLVAPGAQTIASSPSGNRILFTWADRFDLIDLMINSNVEKEKLGQCLASVQFPRPLSATPVIFSEDDYGSKIPSSGEDSLQWIYILAGIGNCLKAFRCPCVPDGGPVQEYGEVRLPGKRVKFIQVVDWPSQSGNESSFSSNPRCKLVVVATTESIGSHIRGYVVDVNNPLQTGKSLLPVFKHDIDEARITAFAVNWTHTTAPV